MKPVGAAMRSTSDRAGASPSGGPPPHLLPPLASPAAGRTVCSLAIAHGSSALPRVPPGCAMSCCERRAAVEHLSPNTLEMGPSCLGFKLKRAPLQRRKARRLH